VDGEAALAMRTDHPDLLTKISDDDIRGWIEIVG
jgi:hypothetical protein